MRGYARQKRLFSLENNCFYLNQQPRIAMTLTIIFGTTQG